MVAVGVGRWGRALRCGPFAGERYEGSLRWLRIGAWECVRMVGLVVRDRAWRTLPPATLRERVSSSGWSVQGRTPIGSAWLLWQLAIAPRPNGIDVRATLRAEGDVVTNRAGIVVLLPAATFAEATFVARHAVGSTSRGTLRRTIAAHQPMVDLRAVRIAAASGGPALALSFEGDTFEMEDHRNWLDPSYKLYSRAMARPTPYRIRHGAWVEQRVTIDVVPGSGRPRSTQRRARRGTLPVLGIATAPDRVPRDPDVVDALAEASPEFILHRTDRRGRGIGAASRLANALRAPLRIEAFGDSARLAESIARGAPESVALYSPGPYVVEMLAKSDIPAAGGTFADFVMVNRNGISATAARATFALCPTVHARDDRSLIESLDTMPIVFDQARALAGERPLDVGPCSLVRRLVPKTGRPATRGPKPGQDAYDVDPRQHALIAAAWLASTIAVAAASGVSSFCTFEGEGARGLVRLGDRRRRVHVVRSPAYAVLAALSSRARANVWVLGLDAQRGAAFVIEGRPTELWLVDLAGVSRDLPHDILSLGPVLQLEVTRKGARWSMSSRRMRGYSIARVGVKTGSSRPVHAMARAWCDKVSRP